MKRWIGVKKMTQIKLLEKKYYCTHYKLPLLCSRSYISGCNSCENYVKIKEEKKIK